MTDRNEIDETSDLEWLQARYRSVMHAIQAGVAAKMEIDPAETTPKHLRVGVNSAMVGHSALALLLMEKGVITELEYWRALAQAAERERALYEDFLSEHLGTRVSLGGLG